MPQPVSQPMSRGMRRTVVVALALLATTAAALPVAHAAPAVATVSVRQDFNGDGYEDLAVGTENGTVNGRTTAGYVAVRYGSKDGLAAGAKKVYSQASTGVPGTPEKGDRFGNRLTTADLDGDGYTDLLVEAGNEHWQYGGTGYTGSRTVLWGGSGGFRSGKVLAPVGSAEYQVADNAAGDFNGDGHQDLVHRGRVQFGPFGRDGRPASAQDGVALTGDDQLLHDVAAGDVDGDGITDLVVSVASTVSDGADRYPRHLNYLRGSRDGLRPFTTLKDAQGNPVKTLGTQLAFGDLNGDGRADLVVGLNELEILYGTTTGPATTAPLVIDQDTPGVPWVQGVDKFFGEALAVGDVNGDGYGDILAGTPGQFVDGVLDAGSFAVVPGGPNGPTGAGTKAFSQNSANVPGSAEKQDQFGAGVDLIDGNGDGRAEAVVGAFGEDGGSNVWVFPATSAGVTAKGSFAFGPRAFGLSDTQLGTAFPN